MKQPSFVVEIEMEMEPDQTGLDVTPHGGYGQHATRGGLSDRNGTTKPTHTRDDWGMRSARSKCSEPRQLREATEQDGVAFSERMRADLDDDCQIW